MASIQDHPYEVFYGPVGPDQASKSFSRDEKAEAVAFAEAHGNGYVYDWDTFDGAPDAGVQHGLTVDDLTEDEYGRYEALSLIEWKPANVSGIYFASCRTRDGDIDLIAYEQDGAWTGTFDDCGGTITAADRFQVFARTAVACIDHVAAKYGSAA